MGQKPVITVEDFTNIALEERPANPALNRTAPTHEVINGSDLFYWPPGHTVNAPARRRLTRAFGV